MYTNGIRLSESVEITDEFLGKTHSRTTSQTSGTTELIGGVIMSLLTNIPFRIRSTPLSRMSVAQPKLGLSGTLCRDLIPNPSNMSTPDHREELKNRMMECAVESTLVSEQERANDALINRMRAYGPLKRQEFTEKEWEKHVDNLEASRKKGIGKIRRQIEGRMKRLTKEKRGYCRRKE